MAATKSEQFEYKENPASAGFLLSGDTTGVFANVLRHSTPVISSIHNRPQENEASQLCGAFSFQAHGYHSLRALLINPAREA